MARMYAGADLAVCEVLRSCFRHDPRDGYRLGHRNSDAEGLHTQIPGEITAWRVRVGVRLCAGDKTEHPQRAHIRSKSRSFGLKFRTCDGITRSDRTPDIGEFREHVPRHLSVAIKSNRHQPRFGHHNGFCRPGNAEHRSDPGAWQLHPEHSRAARRGMNQKRISLAEIRTGIIEQQPGRQLKIRQAQPCGSRPTPNPERKQGALSGTTRAST